MLDFIGVFQGVEFFIVSAAFILVILFSLTIHEFAHSYIAYTQGDVTSKYFGRMSLNPAKHIDPMGFICLLLFGFGWAKPVPINSVKFKNYRKGLFLTSIAGVCANIIATFVFSGLFILYTNLNTAIVSYFETFVYYLLYFGVSINLGLAIFNLLPIPPLDGFNVIASFTKGTNKFVEFLRKYSFVILLAFLILGWIDIIFDIVFSFVLPAFYDFWQFIF
ncbi:MAG: site-2 protease family protein [Clostridiales bacterium]|nr:site-2 protease family protein [Clostridiales bacterium]